VAGHTLCRRARHPRLPAGGVAKRRRQWEARRGEADSPRPRLRALDVASAYTLPSNALREVGWGGRFDERRLHCRLRHHSASVPPPNPPQRPTPTALLPRAPVRGRPHHLLARPLERTTKPERKVVRMEHARPRRRAKELEHAPAAQVRGLEAGVDASLVPWWASLATRAAQAPHRGYTCLVSGFLGAAGGSRTWAFVAQVLQCVAAFMTVPAGRAPSAWPLAALRRPSRRTAVPRYGAPSAEALAIQTSMS
jgi:hypothetical protein